MTLLNRKNLIVVLFALALTFLSAGSTQAQNEGQATQAQNESSDTELISVDFPGGTITEYVNALAKAAGSVNVLISTEAADLSMPPVKLTKVSVSAAIDLVNGTRTDKNDRFVNLDVDHLRQYEANEQETFKINANRPSRGRPTEVKTLSRVWSIAHLIQDGVFNSKVVLDAVEMAIAVTKSTTKVDIRFHEATGLLIASGSTSQLSAIENVLGELGQSQQMKSYESNQKLEKQITAITSLLDKSREQTVLSNTKRVQLTNENKALRLELETQMVRFQETRRIMDEREALLHDTTIKLREVQALLDRQLKQRAEDDKSGNKDN